MEDLTQREHLEATTQVFIDHYLANTAKAIPEDQRLNANTASFDWAIFTKWLFDSKDTEFGSPTG